ncbi:Biotin--protein ligase [hydrothermal vent metagenome]|uniref:Biotin--protein ligase n=1 Tax=hydrothermal vent metagenome TaxID=652676 RepID=A0A3B0U6P0_9ZZZZ
MIGNNIIHLNEVDSTNNYARGVLKGKVEEGSVVLAYSQNQGRGHLQSIWESEPGMNLTFSIILYPEFLDPARQFALSQMASLGIHDFIMGKAGSASIKWPNDIYAGNKKIGGILIESSILGSRFSNSVVGIGLNINQSEFSEWIPNPVSLKLITGVDFNLEECLAVLCSTISEWYEKLKNGHYAELNGRYTSNLYRRGLWADYKSGGQIFKGRITGIDEIGRLLIEKETGVISTFNFKEVEYVPFG